MWDVFIAYKSNVLVLEVYSQLSCLQLKQFICFVYILSPWGQSLLLGELCVTQCKDLVWTKWSVAAAEFPLSQHGDVSGMCVCVCVCVCEPWCCDTPVYKNHKQLIKMMKIIEHWNKKVNLNMIIEHEILLIKWVRISYTDMKLLFL
jgi:hypothetical protein